MRIKLGSCIPCSLLAGLKWELKDNGDRIAEFPWDCDLELDKEGATIAMFAKKGDYLVIGADKTVTVKTKERIHEDENKPCDNHSDGSSREDEERLLPKLRQTEK